MAVSSPGDWRQGDLVRSADVVHVLGDVPAQSGKNHVVIVLSHDCDVSGSDFDREPFVELITGQVVDDHDGNLTHGKNPRRLQLDMSQSAASDALVELSIHDRHWVERRRLVGRHPDSDRGLSSDGRSTLRRWVAKRYNRAAFPDEFNRRIQPCESSMRRVLKQKGMDISAVWLSVSPPTEIQLPLEYDVQLWFTMATDDYDDESKRVRALECGQAVAALVDGCDGISVDFDEVVPEAEFSIESMRVLQRWDYDDLTIRQVDDSQSKLVTDL